MRLSLLLLLSGCFVVYPDYGSDQHYSRYPQTSGDDEAECERPPAPTGPTGKAQLCEPCTSDDACDGEGSLCLPNGVCGRKCVVDCDCPDTYQCRGASGQTSRQCVPASGECPHKPECTADNACPAGKVCESEKCVDRCASDASCATGLRCFEDGHCGKACCLDTECASGEKCATGRCEKA